jgi:hypothetical protein
MQQGRLFTWLSFRSAQPSKVAQFSVGANNCRNSIRASKGPGESPEMHLAPDA